MISLLIGAGFVLFTMLLLGGIVALFSIPQRPARKYRAPLQGLVDYWTNELSVVGPRTAEYSYFESSSFVLAPGATPPTTEQLAIFKAALLEDLSQTMVYLPQTYDSPEGRELTLSLGMALSQAGLRQSVVIPYCTRVRITPSAIYQESAPYRSYHWKAIWSDGSERVLT